jgi:uncharacterized lipoprotein NlpE involved in copper resistance
MQFHGCIRSIEKDTVAYGSGTWVRTHDVWVLMEGHGIVRMLLTEYMVRVWYQSQPLRFHGSVEKDTVAYGSGMWLRMHDAWVLREGHGMVHMLLIERTVCICQYCTYRHGQEGAFLSWG